MDRSQSDPQLRLGLQASHIPSTTARGSWKFDPVIREPSDLKQLRFPEIIYDEEATMQELEHAQDLLGDIWMSASKA